jgi:hypothetical protein
MSIGKEADMIPASRPEDEETRLAMLRRLAVLDTPREPLFDDLVELAATICAAPMAMISFIEGQRIWVKAAHGVELAEMSREVSFCTHTIALDDLLVVPDATRDPRFADSPLVTSSLEVRFYAGIPVGDAAALGTLCVADHAPRMLDRMQEAALRLLARHITRLLTLRSEVIDHDRTGRELERRVAPIVAGLKYDLTWLRGRLGPGGVDPSRAAIASALAEMAELVEGLSATTGGTDAPAPARSPAGLGGTLTWLTAAFARRMHVASEVSIDQDLDAIPPVHALALCAILQEALEAIARLSETRTISVHAEVQRGLVRLDVRHDGGPLGDDAVLTLPALQRRAQALGGDAGVVGAGQLSAWLPLAA